jgi:hypothetical protein
MELISDGTSTAPLNWTVAPASSNPSPWSCFWYSSREISFPFRVMVAFLDKKASNAESNAVFVVAWMIEDRCCSAQALSGGRTILTDMVGVMA